MDNDSTTTQSPEFPVTPYPDFDQMDTKKVVRTAACVIIGDEILNGKTLDTNSHHFASLAFKLGIHLKKIEVVPDDETCIVQCLQRLCCDDFDIVVTSGGIGPTHDDITYQSLAKVFDPNGDLEYDRATIERMEAYTSRSAKTQTRTEEQRIARHRMALFPKNYAEVLFVDPHLWVPVVSLHRRIFILPGVPGLFQQLLQALLCHYIPLPPETEKPHRLLLQTTLPESVIAPILTRITLRIKHQNLDIKVGSYPNLVSGIVNVSLIGSDLDLLHSFFEIIQSEFNSL